MSNTKHDWDAIWDHVKRIRRRVMATKMTKKEFFAEPEDDRIEFYNWLKKQQ